MDSLGPDHPSQRRPGGPATSVARLGVILVTLLAGCVTQGRASQAGRQGSGPTLAVGAPAPAFSLPDHNGEPVSLAGFRGRWVVLYFYPSDDTPGCTAQATEFTELLGRFQEVDATVVGVSADPPLSHRYFRAKYDLGIILLSDPDREAMRRYGVWRQVRWRDQTVGRIIRSTFLIDPTGRIAWRWDHVIPRGHAEQVHRKIEEMATRRGAASGRPEVGEP